MLIPLLLLLNFNKWKKNQTMWLQEEKSTSEIVIMNKITRSLWFLQNHMFFSIYIKNESPAFKKRVIKFNARLVQEAWILILNHWIFSLNPP